MENKHFITKKGLDKLKRELEELKTVKRKEIAARIQEAKELGDLSENAEYVEAKNEQAFVEGRILELENIIKNSVIMDTDNSQVQVVRIGSQIVLENDGQLINYTIVGSTEADPKNNLISCDSPLGQAFLGKKKGDIVKVSIPKGEMEFKINDIK